MPLFWLSLAFLVGLVAAFYLPWTAAAWGLLAGALVLFALVEGRLLPRWPAYRRWQTLAHLPLPMALVLAALALGGLRYASSRPAQTLTEADLAWYHHSGSYRLSGVIQAPPEKGERAITLLIAIDQVAPLQGGDARPVQGLARVRLALGQAWNYGDRVELQGEPAAPQAGANSAYIDYLARQGITTEINYPTAHLLSHDAGSPFWALVYLLRDTCIQTVNRLLPQPEAALLAGILLGSTRDLPQAVQKAFQDTGTAHIIAVSGFNIAIVSGLFVQILGRMMRARFAVPLTILAICGYSLLTGATPSVVRAAIMGGVGLIGPLLGRRQVGVNSLTFTAALMALFSPNLPWNISFQLSFAATLGLVLFADPLQAAFTQWAGRWLPAPLVRRLAGPVGEYFLFTLAAQIFTLPVTAVHFGRFSLSAVLANPLVLPVQPLAMVLGSAALVLGLAFFPLGQLAAWLVWPLLAFTIRTAETLARLPYGSFSLGQVSLGLIALYYLALLALALPALRRRLLQAWKPALGIVLAGLLAAGLWRAALAAPDNRLHLDVLNVPDGPAVLLRSPDGQTWLINGSSRGDALADALGRRLPLLEDRLDGLLLANRSAAPLLGLADLVDRYAPRRLVAGPQLPDSASYKRLASAVKAQGGQVATLEPGAVIDLGRGLRLRVLADTASGTALAIEWDRFLCLLPGGAPGVGLDLPGVTLLVLGQADLRAQDAFTWQERFSPPAAVAAPGEDPLPAGWIALDESLSAVGIVSDGEKLWLERERR